MRERKKCKPNNGDDCVSKNTFFPTSKCDELEVSMRMPNCWDGKNIESPGTNHTGHVAYSADSEFYKECPESHPVKIPQIQLFFRIVPYDGGWHTFSDGSSIYHADYVSGWESTFLQSVLDDCDNEGAGAMPNFFCEDFLTFRDAPKCTDDSCDFSDPNLLKKLTEIQPKIPLNITGTIVSEETKTVKGKLPRGTCKGTLVVNNDQDNDDNDEEKPCVDEPNLKFKNEKNKDCDWVGKKIEKRCGLNWKGKTLEERCPKSCQVCEEDDNDDNEEPCENEPDTVGKFKYKNKDRNCKWVGKRATKLCKKKALSKKCPTTCDVNGCK